MSNNYMNLSPSAQDWIDRIDQVIDKTKATNTVAAKIIKQVEQYLKAGRK